MLQPLVQLLNVEELQPVGVKDESKFGVKVRAERLSAKEGLKALQEGERGFDGANGLEAAVEREDGGGAAADPWKSPWKPAHN